MISSKDASLQAAALTAAADESPVQQVRAALRLSAREWARAALYAGAAEGDELDAEIVLAGTLVAGQTIYGGVAEGTEPILDRVVRLSWQGGVPSILTRDSITGRDVWINTSSSSTPIVIRREP